jgi:hypothetical protein
MSKRFFGFFGLASEFNGCRLPQKLFLPSKLESRTSQTMKFFNDPLLPRRASFTCMPVFRRAASPLPAEPS